MNKRRRRQAKARRACARRVALVRSMPWWVSGWQEKALPPMVLVGHGYALDQKTGIAIRFVKEWDTDEGQGRSTAAVPR